MLLANSSNFAFIFAASSSLRSLNSSPALSIAALFCSKTDANFVGSSAFSAILILSLKSFST
jgi:hypothetical protein